MNPILCLQNGPMRCELIPAMGAAIAGLWHAQRPVMRSTPAAQLSAVGDAGSFSLVPYSNRIGDAELRWAGVTHALQRNFLPEPHAIHGVGWERPWQVLESSATHACLQYQHTPDAAWPFAFVSTQTLTLSDSALMLDMDIRSLANAPVPAGLGWHPYFPKNADTHVAFLAAGRWEMATNMLPTHRVSHAGLDTDCRTLDVDHCFDGWDGVVVLRDGSYTTTVRSDLQRLVVFTHPTRDNIALEPVSHTNNAVALAQQLGVAVQDLGLRVLASGETFAARMQITVEQQP